MRLEQITFVHHQAISHTDKPIFSGEYTHFDSFLPSTTKLL